MVMLASVSVVFNKFIYLYSIFITLFILHVGNSLDMNETDEWSVHHVKGIMKNQYLYIRRIVHPLNSFHSCYQIKCEGNACPKGDSNSIEVCYPAIIVTGLPKCGTSALYDLLSRYPKAIRMAEKENCPYTRRRPHWVYFQSLPRLKDIGENSLIIDGCIDVNANMNMADILRKPKTLYIVLTRNYADLVWSTYNYWCNWIYDGVTCDSTRWVKLGVHTRSPELFHEMVLGDSNGTRVANPFHDIKRPCIYGGGYFTEFLSFKLWRRVPRNQTLAIASEHLEENPTLIWTKITKLLGLNSQSIDITEFSKYRVNTQVNRGAKKEIARSEYQPGLFPISGFRPMYNETRLILDNCWVHDCVMISQITGYIYPVCKKQLLELIALGQFKSFNDIYQSDKYEFKSNIAESIHEFLR